MFLDGLNDKEKEKFLELAHLAIQVDGQIKESELNMFDMFKREMGKTEYIIKHENLDSLVMFFDMQTKKSKKIVLFELAGALLSDDEYDEAEEKWFIDIGKKWGFRDSELKKIVRWVEDFNDLLKEGLNFIERKERL